LKWGTLHRRKIETWDKKRGGGDCPMLKRSGSQTRSRDHRRGEGAGNKRPTRKGDKERTWKIRWGE